MYDSESLIQHLSKYIGETVTIFTTSGGESGSGFTGVVIKVSCDFVRLITRIGPAPSCALGNACFGRDFGRRSGCGCGTRGGNDDRWGWTGPVGSVCDIPVNRIASFVHNAV